MKRSVETSDLLKVRPDKFSRLSWGIANICVTFAFSMNGVQQLEKRIRIKAPNQRGSQLGGRICHFSLTKATVYYHCGGFATI